MLRERSNLLKTLLALNLRMDFSKELLWEVNRFELGYEYECKTDELFEKGNWLMIKGLSLSRRGKFLVQMDLLVLTGDQILLYEEKAYTHPVSDCLDGTIEFTEGGTRYTHPLEQLREAREYLEIIMERLNISLEIDSYVLLTHPNGNIYNLPKWTKNVLIQSQITLHVDEQMRKRKPPTSLTAKYHAQLSALHHDMSEYNSIVPKYDYHELRKIVKCPQCFGVINEIPRGKKLINCPCCHEQIVVVDIIKLAFEDYKILFKKTPTAAEMFHWCGGVFSKIRLHKTLYG